ncbi:hypothetical protein ANN_25443 [Periplaneta americana]|uniref:Uncharacterized protein n=1 Tax=Periplaneta americana TaxID=6978 RepID=A0ABQ8S1S2_PERAM|nr:hypothetical protein ANN_25443 [Periplaneta americana]
MAGLCEGGNEPPGSLKASPQPTWMSDYRYYAEISALLNGWVVAYELTLDSTRCRRCDEQETLPHVLGFCHHGELLRIKRHNTVRSLIAASIRQNASYEVYEEVGCVSSDGSTKRADIIIDRQKDKGVILDPTIRLRCMSNSHKRCVVKNKSYMSLVVSILEHNTTSHIGQFLGSCSVPVARSHPSMALAINQQFILSMSHRVFPELKTSHCMNGTIDSSVQLKRAFNSSSRDLDRKENFLDGVDRRLRWASRSSRKKK